MQAGGMGSDLGLGATQPGRVNSRSQQILCLCPSLQKRAAELGTSGPFWPRALVSDPHPRDVSQRCNAMHMARDRNGSNTSQSTVSHSFTCCDLSSHCKSVFSKVQTSCDGPLKDLKTLLRKDLFISDTSRPTQSIRSSMTMVSCTSLASKASEFLRHKDLISVHASSTNHKSGTDMGMWLNSRPREPHMWVLFGIRIVLN